VTAPRNTSSRGSKRLYSWRDEAYWSVTTIIGGGVPKPALLPWGIKMVAEAAVEMADTLPAMVAADREGAIRFLKGSPYAKRDKAADLGTLVHEAAEAHALGRPMPPVTADVRPYLDSFERFLADFTPEIIATEASVYNRSEHYAGTLDMIARLMLPQSECLVPKTYILDAKSGKDVYPEVGLQLAAYRNAEFIGLPDGSEGPMPAVDGALALHLTVNGYRLIEVRCDYEVYRSFLYAREVFRWQETTSKTVLGAEYGALVEQKQEALL
jgi:hypothetical protein